MQVQVAENTQLAVNTYSHGQPILLLNGFGGFQEIWTAQIKPLTTWGYQVVTFDYRGQGASTGNVATSVTELAGDLHTLLAKMGIKSPILIGHSMGASVIWAFLKDYPDFPVHAVVTIDQSPKMVNTAQWWYGFRGLDEADCPAFFKRMDKAHETLHGLDDGVYSKLMAAEHARPFFRIAAQSLLIDHLSADWRSVVTQITVPTLMLSAKQSPYFPNGYAEWCAAQNKHIQTAIIDNCGHDIMAEVPTAFNEQLHSFLTSEVPAFIR
ncbi:MAG: alpha/beta hydrolase [Schleiferilactobacillus perolens]|uniref:alpha/beta fold hydrolase n=1 Tax=Schleiferilactobacillus perolens TaxID=100468 RepID=UPI0039ECD506